MDHHADAEEAWAPPSFLTPLPEGTLYAWWVDVVDPLAGGDEHMFVGIYGHPASPDSGFTSNPVKDTWTNEAIHFASSYITRSGLWLKLLVP